LSRAAIHRVGLVRTAMRLFRQKGYAATGLQEILTESGAPRGSLYHYFPEGKESLGEAAVVLAGEMVTKMLEELADKHNTPADFVNAYCAQMAEWMTESDFSSGCHIATTVLETTPSSELITRAGVQAFDSWLLVISTVFVRDGLPESQAKSKAELLISAIEGSLILARVRQSNEPILNVATSMTI
jgi:TetR/AcrR family transcriptional repressor of lmrAB and yxaGH operons